MTDEPDIDLFEDDMILRNRLILVGHYVGHYRSGSQAMVDMLANRAEKLQAKAHEDGEPTETVMAYVMGYQAAARDIAVIMERTDWDGMLMQNEASVMEDRRIELEKENDDPHD